MRSSLICVAIVFAAAPAAASPESDVEALVRTTVDHAADASSAASFTKGATVIGIHANVFEFDSGKVTAVVDATAHTAWFAAPLELPGKRTMHVSGVALLQDNRWLLRVLDAELAIPNSELAKHPVLAPRVAMTPATPATKLGKAIVGWFKDHSLGKHAASGVVLAGGSAPQELASGADAIKFAGTLDRIELVPIAIDAADTAPVAIGTAWLAISKQERDGVIQFGFAVYAVQEKGEWRWKSIQFAADQVPARD
jgi:hypothetical protein